MGELFTVSCKKELTEVASNEIMRCQVQKTQKKRVGFFQFGLQWVCRTHCPRMLWIQEVYRDKNNNNKKHKGFLVFVCLFLKREKKMHTVSGFNSKRNQLWLWNPNWKIRETHPFAFIHFSAPPKALLLTTLGGRQWTSCIFALT